MLQKEFPQALLPLLDIATDVLTVEKDTYLFHEGDQANELYVIKSGKVKISKLSNDGNELTLRHSHVGDLAGELSLIEEVPHYIVNAQMIVKGKIAVVAKDELKKQLLNDGQLALELIKLMNHYRLRDQTRFRDLILFGKKGALYSTLIRLANSYGQTTDDGIFINTRMTDQALADFCGTSRESINRLMRTLRNKQILTTNRSYITIHDLIYLKNEINCDDCPISICNIH